MLKLILIRHGVTGWNKENRLMGSTDMPLSNEGIKQAERLADRLKHEKIDIIYSSPLKRAYKTAEIINRFHNCKIIKEQNLKEISYGIFEGISKEEREKDDKLNEIWRKRKEDVVNFRIPKGESFSDLRERAKKALQEILKYDNKTILVVSHGQTKRALIQLLTNMSDQETQKLYFDTTALSIFEIDKKDIKTVVINCAKHLE